MEQKSCYTMWGSSNPAASASSFILRADVSRRCWGCCCRTVSSTLNFLTCFIHCLSVLFFIKVLSGVWLIAVQVTPRLSSDHRWWAFSMILTQNRSRKEEEKSRCMRNWRQMFWVILPESLEEASSWLQQRVKEKNNSSWATHTEFIVLFRDIIENQ